MVPNERLGDRRAELRFEIIGDLWATLVTIQNLPVLNLGFGGMLVESTSPLLVGSLQRLRLSIRDESSDLGATVRHVTAAPGRPDRYLIGLEFADLSPDARRQIDAYLGGSGSNGITVAEA